MGKTNNNESGFSAIEIVLVIVIIVLLGAVGWFVYRNHNKTTNSTATTNTTTANPSNSTSTSATVKPTTNSTKQTVTYKTAKFSFDLPKGWKYSGAPSTMQDEYDGYVVNPTKKIQLSIYIQKISDWKGSSVSSGPYQASFTGISGKTYYLEESGPSENSVNQISVGACGPNACKTLDDHTTKLNDTYWLNLAIDPGSDAIAPYKLSVNDPAVTQIKAIIHSITIE